MAEDTAVALIRDVGLPAVVILWFLFRLEPRIDELTIAVKGLIIAVQAHATGTHPQSDDTPRR